MLLTGKSRSLSSTLRQGVALLALAMIVGVCLVRLTPVGVAGSTGAAAVAAAAKAGHRPCFDYDGLEWVRPAARFSIHLPEVVALQRPANLEARSAFESNGVHYDRPPPSV